MTFTNGLSHFYHVNCNGFSSLTPEKQHSTQPIPFMCPGVKHECFSQESISLILKQINDFEI